MAQVDIITGKPRMMAREESRAAADERAITEGQAVQQALDSDQGKALVKIIRDELIARAEQLLNADAKAQAFMTILNQIGSKINAAQTVIDKSIKGLRQ